jgi:hypothetical protein
MIHNLAEAKEIYYKFKTPNGETKIVAIKGAFVTGNIPNGSVTVPIPIFQNNNPGQ